MSKTHRLFEQKILKELENIPERELPQIFEMIRYLKLGILAMQEINSDSKVRDEQLLDSPKAKREQEVAVADNEEYSTTPYFSFREMAE